MGTLAEDRLHVLAFQGYTYEIYEDSPFVLLDQLPAAQQALHSGDLAYEPQTERAGLLVRTQGQIVLPLYRETAVISLLVLVSTQPNQWQPEDLTFLKRLGNHAAIALANAQLVEAMKVANQAKSEFVSFVSHELKIPMTSIKGYADLLLSGHFGPLNEAQTTFLDTFRNNVNRMNRLVTDLTDVSRLESGQLHLETRPIQLAEVVAEVASSTRAQIEEKQQSKLKSNFVEHIHALNEIVWQESKNKNRDLIQNYLTGELSERYLQNSSNSTQKELSDHYDTLSRALSKNFTASEIRNLFLYILRKNSRLANSAVEVVLESLHIAEPYGQENFIQDMIKELSTNYNKHPWNKPYIDRRMEQLKEYLKEDRL